MSLRRVALGDVCAQDRASVRPGRSDGLPYLGLEGIEAGTGQFATGELSKTPETPQANSFRFDDRHVLYGKLRPYLNKVALPTAEGKCSTEIVPLLPSPHLDRRYLGYYLRSPKTVAQITERSAGARMPRADMDFVLSLSILLPPVEEQHRIVDLLARAEGIVRLRRQAQHKAAELIPAIFIDMFGDPAANPRRLPPLRPVHEVVARFEGGKNLQAGDDREGGLRILKVSAVTSGVYRETESKPSPDGYAPPKNHYVRSGDLLFSRANTAELVGATAMVESTNGKTLLPDKLWRFVWRCEVDVAYMHALFQTPASRGELTKLASGTSDSMRNISQAKLFKLRLPIAAISEQRRFGELSKMARSMIAQQVDALGKAQATFYALLARAFGGCV